MERHFMIGIISNNFEEYIRHYHEKPTREFLKNISCQPMAYLCSDYKSLIKESFEDL